MNIDGTIKLLGEPYPRVLTPGFIKTKIVGFLSDSLVILVQNEEPKTNEEANVDLFEHFESWCKKFSRTSERLFLGTFQDQLKGLNFIVLYDRKIEDQPSLIH